MKSFAVMTEVIDAWEIISAFFSLEGPVT